MPRSSGLQSLVQYGKFPVRLFLVMFFIRCIDLVLIQSSYVPDEYWQSLEVAHKKAFGYGYLTWEWTKGIRSYFYVSIFYILYEGLKLLQIDSPELVILLPRILQGLLSALADVYFVRWIYEKRSGQFSWGLLSWATTFFISYCSTRTLINTFEMNLTVIALYYYPWTPKSDSIPFVAIVSLLFYIRPTALVLWLPMIVVNIVGSKRPLNLLITHYIPVFVAVSALNIGLDSYFHDSLVFTTYNFFKANIVDNIGSYYGSHDFFWYLYAGLPTVLGIQIFPFYYRAFLRLSNSNFLRSLSYDVEAQMIFSVVFTVSVLSVVPHKEFRFLLPLVPMAIFVSSGTLGNWSTTAKSWALYVVGAALIVGNMSALVFLGRYHTAAPINTMAALRNDIGNSTSAKLLFLAPCHSFPLYSHLHLRIAARFLTCTPNFRNESDYLDETDKFYQNPPGWLRSQYATLQPCTLPTHIIKYDTLNITNFLYINNYTLTDSIFNSLYFYPNHTGEFVQVYKRKGKLC